MGHGKKTKRRSHSRQTDDVEHVGKSSTGFSIPRPLRLGIHVLQLIFGLVFIIIGSINIGRCKISPLIPIWLILMGATYIITAVLEYNDMRLSAKSGYRGRPTCSLILTLIIAAITVGLFIMGNVIVYEAWGVTPDYGHYWFSNGCDKSTYLLAFAATIVMDAIFGLIIIGILIYAVFSFFK